MKCHVSFPYIPKLTMSLSYSKYGNTLDILLLRTNMSEWKVWVTMPQVAAPALPNTLQQQTALSRSAPRLYLSRPSIALYFSVSTSVFVPSQHCISVPTISTASSLLFPFCTVVLPICTLWIVVCHMSSLECYSPVLENLCPLPLYNPRVHIRSDVYFQIIQI